MMRYPEHMQRMINRLLFDAIGRPRGHPPACSAAVSQWDLNPHAADLCICSLTRRAHTEIPQLRP
jgi:hypothetical protein